MPTALEQLEEKREALYERLQKLGDFRPGSISVNFRKCGKKQCACARRAHPGHGPQYLWNTTAGGQSRAQNLHLGPELEKARRELETHQVFLQLCRELVEVNEKICRLRQVVPVRDEKKLEELKKKLQKEFLGRRRRR